MPLNYLNRVPTVLCAPREELILWRVSKRFLGMRDLPYLKDRIWDFKAKWGRQLRKHHLKSEVALPQTFISFISSRLIRQMLAIFFGAEF